MPRGLAAFVLLSLLFVPAPASAGSPPIPPHVVTLAAHAPVLIEGDAALGTSDAVVSGSGTPLIVLSGVMTYVSKMAGLR